MAKGFKTGGRQKGTPNKFNAEVRDVAAIQRASRVPMLPRLGAAMPGTPYLTPSAGISALAAANAQ